MYDVNLVNKRYFSTKIGGKRIDIEPPKVKTLKRVIALTSADKETVLDELTIAIEMIVNKNKTNVKISKDVIDELTTEEQQSFLTNFFTWVNGTKKAKN
jgi:hypothetical protein